MNQTVSNDVKILFLQQKDKASSKEWNNAQYLRELAIDYESENLELAFLLMQRANELNPNGPVIQRKLEEYRKGLAQKNTGDLSSKNRVLNSLNKMRIIDSEKGVFDFIKSPFILLALMPLFLFSIYQLFIASPRYESQAQIIVQQPDGMSTMDPSMALLSGLGVPSSNKDTELVKAFVYSNDMLGYLDTVLNLEEHYKDSSVDYFSRLETGNSREDFIKYYKSHVSVVIDEDSSVITIKAQGFDPLFALKLNQLIVDRAEWYINEIGHQLANEQLKFIQGEHELVESKLKGAQTKLLNFQQKHQLLDPEAEGLAMQQITYGIESQIATKQAELRMLQGVMSENAPQVISIENEIIALKEQLNTERQRLSRNENESLSVSQVLARFTDYKVEMELALKAFMSSQVSLEKSRIEAYRQLKYLVIVESPTSPEENSYPRVFYNISLFGLCILLGYGICNIIVATIRELN